MDVVVVLSACNLIFHRILWLNCVLHKLKDLWHVLIWMDRPFSLLHTFACFIDHFMNTQVRKKIRNSNGEHVKLDDDKQNRNEVKENREEKNITNEIKVPSQERRPK